MFNDPVLWHAIAVDHFSRHVDDVERTSTYFGRGRGRRRFDDVAWHSFSFLALEKGPGTCPGLNQLKDLGDTKKPPPSYRLAPGRSSLNIHS